MRAVPFLAAAFLFTAAANAQPVLLSGTIGKAPVFLDLDRTGDTVSGWYFYLKVGKQIRLEGKVDRSGQFDIQEYTASTNSRTGSFKGRIRGGHWTGTWTSAVKKKNFAIAFDEIRGTLKNADGRLACTVRTRDGYGNRSRQSIDLTLKSGRVKALKLALSERSGGGTQRCHLALADLKQAPAKVGIHLKARGDRPGGEHRCSVRLLAAGDYLVARIGDARQDNDDCRGAGDTMFCSPNTFWLGLAVNRKTQACKQVK